MSVRSYDIIATGTAAEANGFCRPIADEDRTVVSTSTVSTAPNPRIMMAPTHVTIGLSIAAVVSSVTPFWLAPAVGGFIGSIVPDLDLFAGSHRRTLHFPVLGWLPALVASVVAWIVPSPISICLAVGTVAFALHAVVDIAGAGEEPRPWERTNPFAVYCHACGRWFRARYWVRYDGALEDLGLTIAFALPVLWVYDGWVALVAIAAVIVGAVYAVVRRRIPEYVASTSE